VRVGCDSATTVVIRRSGLRHDRRIRAGRIPNGWLALGDTRLGGKRDDRAHEHCEGKHPYAYVQDSPNHTPCPVVGCTLTAPDTRQGLPVVLLRDRRQEVISSEFSDNDPRCNLAALPP
jgi:hypothetical protein